MFVVRKQPLGCVSLFVGQRRSSCRSFQSGISLIGVMAMRTGAQTTAADVGKVSGGSSEGGTSDRRERL